MLIVAKIRRDEARCEPRCEARCHAHCQDAAKLFATGELSSEIPRMKSSTTGGLSIRKQLGRPEAAFLPLLPRLPRPHPTLSLEPIPRTLLRSPGAPRGGSKASSDGPHRVGADEEARGNEGSDGSDRSDGGERGAGGEGGEEDRGAEEMRRILARSPPRARTPTRRFA